MAMLFYIGGASAPFCLLLWRLRGFGAKI